VELEPAIFSDGFESGDATGWQGVGQKMALASANDWRGPAAAQPRMAGGQSAPAMG